MPPQLSEAHFLVLAREAPAQLAEWTRSVLSRRPDLLTFAAEAAGRITHTPLALSILLPLLWHHDASVREGAVYGLTSHLSVSIHARDALRELLGSESSPGVTTAIEEALSMLG